MDGDSNFHWTSGARTDVGLVRTRNEDAYLALPGRGLWAVADGMGGHAYGDVASGAVVAALDGVAPPASLAGGVDAVRARLDEVNHDLREEAAARGVPVIGSTVVVLLALDRELACLWAGDSRIYLCREGRLQQLTRDHSQLEALKASGADLAAATASPNMITRAVGASDTLELDVATLRARDGDVFLLCSDGLSNPVDEAALAAGLAACADCSQAAHELVALALANGGRDNITALVVRVEDRSGDKTVLNPAV